jgi:excisionase family DNA binding protein
MNTQKDSEIGIDTLLTSYQVGTILQVNPSSVNKWVKDGRIPAFRTPGGHRRIRAGDLVSFLHAHKMPVPSSLANASRKRVLVVDANDTQRTHMQQALSAYEDRVQVESASDPMDAMLKVGTLQPHVVLVDLDSPGMDGLDICRRMKNHLSESNIHIITVASETSEELGRKSKEAGASQLMSKPVATDAVLTVINSL